VGFRVSGLVRVTSSGLGSPLPAKTSHPRSMTRAGAELGPLDAALPDSRAPQ